MVAPVFYPNQPPGEYLERLNEFATTLVDAEAAAATATAQAATATTQAGNASTSAAAAAASVAGITSDLEVLSAGVAVALDIGGLGATAASDASAAVAAASAAALVTNDAQVVSNEVLAAGLQAALDLLAVLAVQLNGGASYHGAGSATEPSVSASGDTNTGMFFPAADVVALATAGLERMRVDANGTLTHAAGVATTAVAALAILQTWNNAGVTFPGLKFTVTDTASAAGSMAFQLLGGAAGATSLLSVDKAGSTKAQNLVAAAAAAAGAAGTVTYGGTTQTTIGANGGAAALTAAPLGYIKIYVAGVPAIIPYYNA